ncbi:MAG: hypothetical protein KDB99_14400 [Chitinophagaceae bacterium]|nr:hypothetical protein [Chitinophagaceae bacterium]
MVKLIIGALVLLAAGIVWLRAQWARSKNSNTANQIINDLKSGKYGIESYAESLSILIYSKAVKDSISVLNMPKQFESLSGSKLLDKFSIQYAAMNESGKGIIIAEAKDKDIIPMYNGNKEVDIHFPCWIYIDINKEDKKVDFKSTFPESKEHHYLLEDLSKKVFELISSQAE